MGQARVGMGIVAAALMMMLAEGAPVEAQGRGHKGFRIPPGHLPAPGDCRVWYPGVPPGHQPPAVPCRALRGQRFPGGVVVGLLPSRDVRDRRYVVREERWFEPTPQRRAVRRPDARRARVDGWLEIGLFFDF